MREVLRNLIPLSVRSSFHRTVALGKRPRIRRIALLVLILLALGALKVRFTAHTHHTGIDGGYYTNVAQHVRDGRGLKTNISLYHKAYTYFPHPTSIYPAWPLLYGYTAKVFPLLEVGRWLPTLLYFLTLIFGYLWAARLAPEDIFAVEFPYFNAGHLFVLCLGLQAHFFEYTSVPFAEGLAYAALLGGLWRGHAAFSSPNLRRGLELGVWLALAMLALSHLFIAALVTFVAYLWAVVAVAPRRRYAAAMLGCALSLLVLVGPHYAHIVQFVEDPRLWSLLRFDWNRENSYLTYVQMIKDYDSGWGFIRDRLVGFPLAFAPEGDYAYANGFYSLQYAPLIALPFLLMAALTSGRRKISRALRWLRASSNQPRIFALLLAIAGFFSIHAIRKVYCAEWNFAQRQSIICLFLFFLSLLYLLRNKRLSAVIAGLVLICGSAYIGFRDISRMPSFDQERLSWTERRRNPKVHAERFARYERRRDALARWLLKRLNERGELTVIMPADEVQRIVNKTPGVNYHWMYEGTDQDDLKVMVSELNAHFLLANTEAREWLSKLRSQGFNELFRRRTRVRDIVVFAPKRGRKRDPSAAPAPPELDPKQPEQQPAINGVRQEVRSP